MKRFLKTQPISWVMMMLDDHKGAELPAYFCSLSDINLGGRAPDYTRGLRGAGPALVSFQSTLIRRIINLLIAALH